jgi:hypothetical protein
MQLQRLLFEPTLVRSPLRVMQWWERRRLTYNVVVGATGLVTLGVANAIELTFGNGWFPVPWQVIVAYGLAANVCYTAGWMVENMVERLLRRPVYGLGPAMFRYGLVLSVGITLLPVGLVAVVNLLGRLLAP